MNTLEFLEDQIDYYEGFVIDLEHEMDLLEQKRDIYKEKLQDYKNLRNKLADEQGIK
jgi:hypothetical protein